MFHVEQRTSIIRHIIKDSTPTRRCKEKNGQLVIGVRHKKVAGYDGA
jgi:hypothetical protein